MEFVFLFQPAQDRDRILDAGFVGEHRLEAALQRRVLFDMLAIFVQRGRADAMQFAARKGWLEQVGGVHRALALARADQGVHLVDEQDDRALGGGDLIEHRLKPFLELAPVFCAGDERSHVEGQQLLVFQRFGHVAVDDSLSEPLDNRGFPHPRLTDQHRVVFCATRQNLNGAPNFLVAAYHRVKLFITR